LQDCTGGQRLEELATIAETFGKLVQQRFPGDRLDNDRNREGQLVLAHNLMDAATRMIEQVAGLQHEVMLWLTERLGRVIPPPRR